MVIFLNISVGLMIINIMYEILPDSSYNKYLKVIVGMILLLIVIGNSAQLNLENEASWLEKTEIKLENENYSETLHSQLEFTIGNRIKEELSEKFSINADVCVKTENNEITRVEVLCERETDKAPIINYISGAYNLDSGRIFVKNDYSEGNN